MSVEQTFPKVTYWSMNKCPLCGEDKPVIANGLVRVGEELKMFPDRGFAFCNCKNIWFTDWSNNDGDKILGEEQKIDSFKYHLYNDSIENLGYGYNKFKVVGKHGSKVEEEARRLGFDVDSDGPYNIVWAYHTIEHVKDPIQELKKYSDMLVPGGRLFLASPDPFFIEFDNVYTWGHWLLREHHIMWDMDSLCDEAERIGFKVLYGMRNTQVDVKKDFHLIFER